VEDRRQRQDSTERRRRHASGKMQNILFFGFQTEIHSTRTKNASLKGSKVDVRLAKEINHGARDGDGSWAGDVSLTEMMCQLIKLIFQSFMQRFAKVLM